MAPQSDNRRQLTRRVRRRAGPPALVVLALLAVTALLAPAATGALHPPVNLKPPTIIGKAQVGKTLTASHGSWTGSPTSYAYRWLRCAPRGAECTSIAGGSGASHLLALADVRSTLRVRVTASNGAGDSSATSEPSELVTGLVKGAPAHVMVIVEENRNRGEVIGASSMPYFNSLASAYGNTTAWDGVGHPSLPNYLALISGSTQGVGDD